MMNYRYRNLKPVGDGSYGFVCAADDTVSSPIRFANKEQQPSSYPTTTFRLLLLLILIIIIQYKHIFVPFTALLLTIDMFGCNYYCCNFWGLRHVKVTGRKVAIKKVGDTFCDLVDAKRILREIKLLRHFIGHENIIQIYDIMTIPPDSVDFRDVYIVTNLMVGKGGAIPSH